MSSLTRVTPIPYPAAGSSTGGSASYLNANYSNVTAQPYNLGVSSQNPGGIYATSPLYDYEASKYETQLENHFGLAGSVIGPAVRYMYGEPRSPQLFDHAGNRLPEGVPNNTGLAFGGTDSNGRSVGGSVSIDWGLVNKEATFGTSEWARKIARDLTAPSSGDPNYDFLTSSLQDKYKAAGTQSNAGGLDMTKMANGSYIKKTTTPVTSFTEKGNTYQTLAENVQGYGQPSIGQDSRLAPYGSFAGQQGTIFMANTVQERIGPADTSFRALNEYRGLTGGTTVDMSDPYEKYWGVSPSNEAAYSKASGSSISAYNPNPYGISTLGPPKGPTKGSEINELMDYMYKQGAYAPKAVAPKISNTLPSSFKSTGIKNTWAIDW